MEKQRSITLEAALLTALLALLGLTLLAAPAAPTTGGEVIVTGWLHVKDITVQDVIMVVEVDGERCQYAGLAGSGRFTLTLVPGTEARLIFMKPGHITKEVVVDTRNSATVMRIGSKPRKVKFDVALEPEAAAVGRTYKGPVGTLGFSKGSGALTVKHHKRYAPKDH